MYEEEIHFVKLLIKQPETVLVHLTLVTLTFDPKINRVSPLPRTDGPSLRKVGQGVLVLLIGNRKVTDRPTCTKQYAFSSFKGGINIML